MAASGRNRPRWFAPVLLLGMLGATVALVGLGVLLHEPPDGQIAIGERTYVVPPAEVSTIRPGPPGFIRIQLPGRPFQIVHDQKIADGRDSAGVPNIFSVNDGNGHDVVYDRQGGSIVVCRRASNPVGGCGTWIEYGETTWSVLFPESRANEADKFVREALGALRRYDTASNRLVP